jgi:hypothetical protein
LEKISLLSNRIVKKLKIKYQFLQMTELFQ